LQTLNLSQHLFRLGFHLEVGKFGILLVWYAELILDGIQHLQHSGQLILGQQVNMQVQVSTKIPRLK